MKSFAKIPKYHMKTLIDLDQSITSPEKNFFKDSRGFSSKKLSNSKSKNDLYSSSKSPLPLYLFHSNFKIQQKKNQKINLMSKNFNNSSVRVSIGNTSRQKNSQTHSRKISLNNTNKENTVNFMKPPSNKKQQTIVKFKEQIQSVLKNKTCLSKPTVIYKKDIKTIFTKLNILHSTNPFYDQFIESIIQMMKINYQKLLCVNLYIILLALYNYKVEIAELKKTLKMSYDYNAQWLLILEDNQIKEIYESYQQIKQKQSKNNEQSKAPPKNDDIHINITLSDNKKQEIVFKNCCNPTQIAQKIVRKYNISSDKQNVIEQLIKSKLSNYKKN